MTNTDDNMPEDPLSGEAPQPDTTSEGIAADRSFPSIAAINGGQKLAGIAVCILAGMAAMACVYLNGANKSTPKPLTAQKETPFRTPQNSTPYIMTESGTSNPNNSQLSTQKEIALQQAALQMAMDEQKKQEKRNLSSQIDGARETIMTGAEPASIAAIIPAAGTYQAATTGSAIPASASSASSNAPLAGAAATQDPNLAFAAQNADKTVETAQASQLANLHTLIAQGAMIPGILETAIASNLPGMVRAIVSENIYSFDGFDLLIPEGSRLIGQYRSGLVNGQSRVFIIWTRLIRNDGVSINVGSYGADALGRSGLAGDIDTHFFERFGSSVMLSMIDSGLQAAANANNKTSTALAVNTGSDFSSAAAIALQNSINIPPTINIDQGTRINVFVGKDLDFSRVGGIKQAEAEQPAETPDAE
jgi:type IV secretory pathway VirB10-like protein